MAIYELSLMVSVEKGHNLTLCVTIAYVKLGNLGDLACEFEDNYMHTCSHESFSKSYVQVKQKTRSKCIFLESKNQSGILPILSKPLYT